MCVYNYFNQSINENLYSPPFKIPTQRRSRPRPSGKEQSSKAGETENRFHLGGASDLRIDNPFQVVRPAAERVWKGDRSLGQPAEEERRCKARTVTRVPSQI